MDRSHWGRLRLSGEDRLAFLHGQTTNDIQALKPGTGCDTVRRRLFLQSRPSRCSRRGGRSRSASGFALLFLRAAAKSRLPVWWAPNAAVTKLVPQSRQVVADASAAGGSRTQEPVCMTHVHPPAPAPSPRLPQVFVTAQARCIDIATVYAQPSGALVVVSPSLKAQLLERLQKYIFSADKARGGHCMAPVVWTGGLAVGYRQLAQFAPPLPAACRCHTSYPRPGSSAGRHVS